MEILTTDGYEKIMHKYHVNSLCAKVLAAYQLQDEQIHDILSHDELLDPFSMQGIKEVIQRLHQAKQNQEKVLVCGDYDADGICATTILFDALQRFGITAGFYIPNRFKEGYGLQSQTVEMAKEKGYQLLITVDNGVKAMDALQCCKKLQIDVIVTDHHSYEEEVPCDYFLHSQTLGEGCEYFCGAAIALQISRALLGEVKEHVVLACIASIGDVMPLFKETRKIVRKGIAYLKEGVCLPVQALANDAFTKWDEKTIAFQIVPKLNATGRLADLANANNTVRFLLCKDRAVIMDFVKQINQLNNKRRTLSTKMTDHARTLIQEDCLFQVLHDATFHEGLIGLSASKLAEELQQPVMLFAGENDVLKGSIRSLDQVDLRTFFEDCPIPLLAYGGHRAAAGISIQKKDLLEFKQFVQEKMQLVASDPIVKEPSVIACHTEELSVESVLELEKLAPFGQGFEKPLFYIQEYGVQTVHSLKEGKHVKWIGESCIDALLFHAKEQFETYTKHASLSFLGTIGINEFRGEQKVNIFVEEVIC